MSDKKRNVIGFLSDPRPSPATMPPEGSALENQALLTTDSGRPISFSQGCRNIAGVGQTGSGKTDSLITPTLHSLFQAGYGGLIIDPKGTMGNKVRAAAAKCGRADDVVEFGTSPTACKTNLFGGMKPHEMSTILRTIALDGLYQDHNSHFFEAGASKAGDVTETLYNLSKIAPKTDFSRQLTPSLSLVYEMYNNDPLAYGLFRFHQSEFERMKKQYGENQMPGFLVQAGKLCARVEGDKFHVLTPGTGGDSSHRDTRQEQMTYRNGRICDRLHEFKITYGLMDRFSCVDDDAVPLDFGKLVYRGNKIVFVQCDVDSGPAGELICRLIKEQYYKAIMKHGKRLEAGRFTFMVVDEFQYVVDVNRDHRLNDMQLFCVSRELRNINMIATQNVASLYAMGSERAIASLLGNCTTKIMLQNSDPDTMDWAERFREDARDMKNLERGQCFLETVDDNDRVVSEKDGFNNAYASVQGILQAARELAAKPASRPAPREYPYGRGSSGMPQAMERCLVEIGKLTEEAASSSRYGYRVGGYSELQVERKAAKANRRIEALCDRLRRMRELSARGKPFWEESWEAADEDDALSS